MDYLVLCIGNRTGGDDAIGPYIADHLQIQGGAEIGVVDCGTTPENYTSIVKQSGAKHLVIIDAVGMGLTPGEVRIVPKEKIGRMHISTHGIPLSVLVSYLEDYVETIMLIGIQPKTFSGELSSELKKSGDRVIQLLQNKSWAAIRIFH